jgi:hypothetical protein
MLHSLGMGGGQEPSVTTIELTLQKSVTYGGPVNLNFNARNIWGIQRTSILMLVVYG